MAFFLAGLDFQLVTLLCVNEYGAGLPMAFCITSRVDKIVMEVFIKAIREKTGKIQVKAFMSEDGPIFYNAWRVILGDAKRQLLCA